MNRQNLQRKSYFKESSGQFVRLTVCPTTGGRLQLSVSSKETIDGLKCKLAKKLRLRSERLSILHKDRLLTGGSVQDNHLCNDSQLTLVLNMETGTATNMRPDSRVMQALENLSESQVNDFLTGRAPLLLAMKLGEHMMFVQLQLSSTSCNGRRRSVHTQQPTGCSQASNMTAQSKKPACLCNHGTKVPSTGNGAVIDSVQNLGQGIYSGKFSGTLDPSIQESHGKPKRDINTILHILNDLLVASPQFRNSTAQLHTPYAPPSRCDSQSPPLTQTRLGEQISRNNPHEPSTDALRGKVQTLQKLMQERKQRRQQKRGLRAPYQWSDRRASFNRRVSQSSHINFDSSLTRDREVGKKTENLSSAEATFSTQSSAMEHESVLV